MQYTVNEIPSKTWNWMKINRNQVELSVPFNYKLSQKHQLDEAAIFDSLKEKYSFESGICNFANPKLDAEEYAPDAQNVKVQKEEAKSASEHELYKMIESAGTTESAAGESITITRDTTKPLVLELDSTDNAAYTQTIVVNEGCRAQIILVYKKSDEKPGTQFVRTQIAAKKDSYVELYKVQLLNNSTLQLDDTAITCEENAKAGFTLIELGGKEINSGLHVSLNGDKSIFESNTAYLCQNEQKLDINHIVYHYGKKTECKMLVNGTLKDTAVKTYRGTIDFKNGCAGSKGNEMEEVLLLNPKVVNKSLPVILCDEEDVEGEHGATIGRLSNEILFYMETRGISQAEAERLMARAKVDAAAGTIPDESVKQEISDFLDNLI